MPDFRRLDNHSTFAASLIEDSCFLILDNTLYSYDDGSSKSIGMRDTLADGVGAQKMDVSELTRGTSRYGFQSLRI